ncbi:MAG: TlyA family RNA methyltransferase [Candidatus Lokiarchaeota archaeon]|nr:TlyA family RNA methyltransferase [Candidatus Lokiarchaeota archaeon]
MKERLDIVLVERRLVESRTKAQWLIKNGLVLVDDKKIIKPGKLIDNSSTLRLIKEYPYVGRGGLKLEAALKYFSINVHKLVCADIGASIGGFTDCLIKSGAQKVYAIDIAKDFLHPSLRCEKMRDKVIPILGVDMRNMNSLDELMDLVVIDVTFTSIKEILPKAFSFLKQEGIIISLIKPIFETNFYEKSKFDIISDKEQLKNILLETMEWCVKYDIYPQNLMKSPILGSGGAVEFFIFFKKNDNQPINFINSVKKTLD